MSDSAPIAESLGVDYFKRDSRLTNLQIKYSLRARRRLFDRFTAFLGDDLEGMSILDVGATPDTERADSNCMVPWLLDRGAHVTMCSRENLDHLADRYPGVDILQPNTGKIPVPDDSFDALISSATIEHVGNEAAQRAFITDCARVAGRIGLTTPNRGHWLEFHTKFPLLHWLPRRVHQRLLDAMGQGVWATEDHLRLLGKRDLMRLGQEATGGRYRCQVETVTSLGMTSNLLLLVESRQRHE